MSERAPRNDSGTCSSGSLLRLRGRVARQGRERVRDRVFASAGGARSDPERPARDGGAGLSPRLKIAPRTAKRTLAKGLIPAGALLASTLASLAAHAEVRTLPALAVDSRGELLLDDGGKVRYQRWQLEQLPADARAGLLMVLPARPSSRKDLAPFEAAMRTRNDESRGLVSTTIVNLDDAAFGAGMMVEGRLSEEKKLKPAAHLVVDERGTVRNALDLAEGDIHVLLHDCNGRIITRHQGPFTVEQVQQFLARIDNALQAAFCGSPGQVQ